MSRLPGGPWAWLVALAVVSFLLPALSYGTRDADSRLHAEIAARLSAQPVSRWIAPEWPPGWYVSGPYVEHPVGFFLVPAALGRMGYPPAQAAYLANAAWQIASLLLAAALARTFASGIEAGALLFLFQLVPIAFTYRIRANHEQTLLLLLLVALYATERTRTRSRWAPVLAGALVGMVLVKGLVGLMGVPVCALWLLARGDEDTTRRGVVGAWAALSAGVVAIGLATAAYEALYRGATGGSFIAAYLGRQVGPATASQSEALLAQKAYNLVWYLGRLLWFPFPWSLAALLAAWTGAKAVARGAPRSESRTALRGLAFSLGVAALYAGLFSLSDRRADRYIFPAYFAVAAAGAVAAMRDWPPMTRLAARLDRWPAWSPAALWLLLVLLHVAGGRILHLPTIKLWAPDS
ncbi:MAG: hypothetical protein A2V74_03445 [Acidobacteria bacterium RBG_16_70_10]|nr:MAG: hypothetical protein A2V74_03445 [Acidobacteria bacterium RBG_16_70_10]